MIACTRPIASTPCSSNALEEPDVALGQTFVIAGIGVDDAAAARRHAGEAVVVQRLEERGDRALLGDILKFYELVTGANLPGGYNLLNVDHHHRNDIQRLGDAQRFRDQAVLDHLRFDLPEAGLNLGSPPPEGIRTPAGRIIGLTTSPTRRMNCSTFPETPA